MLDSISTQTTKRRITDAAEDIVMKLGAAHLTFDELAKQTGLSKGGILYHYPSKKALLRDMVETMIGTFEEKRERIARQTGQPGPGGARTYIVASFDTAGPYRRSSTALMAAAASDPELLEVVRDHYKRNFAEIRAMGGRSTVAAMIFLALDGMWLLDSLQLCMMTDDERHALKDQLLQLAEENHV